MVKPRVTIHAKNITCVRFFKKSVKILQDTYMYFELLLLFTTEKETKYDSWVLLKKRCNKVEKIGGK